MSYGTAAQPSRVLPVPSLATLAAAMTALAVLTLFLVSSKVLQWLGLPYATSGGSALAKFHPATFLAIAALLLAAAAAGFGRFTARAAIERPGLVAFAFAILLLLFQAVIIQKLPLSAIVDTFMLPLALFLAICALSDRTGSRLALALHVVFFANSAIGYLEYTTGFRLTPYYMGSEVITYDWRATALFGHPLSNALITGAYLLVLANGGGKRFDVRLMAFLLVFHLGALAAFGGRAATIVVLALLALRGGVASLGILAGRPVSRRAVITVAVVATLVATLGTLAVLGGFLDSFLDRFQDDHGSANTRIAMFHVFDGTSWHDMVFAPDLNHIAANQRRLDLAIAIESFIVAFFAYYGAVTMILFFAGLLAFCAEIVRVTGASAIMPIAYFFIVSSTSTGIANKTVDLGMLTAMLLLFLTPRFLPAARRQARPC